ncbi:MULTISPECIES: hypothetical protein [Carnobacteriaceae]|uniref:Uncharacterized protein n=1 Tax=Pisciglobus halotolerans TaxID=745365 RepID=A0A1I3D9R2_9LACT|nr:MULTISPECIES: hypothetical protein [Carnobacteriaceae]EGP5302192.1 hypothetical protein [Enterococcus faecium]SLC86481.1 Uncharacterised protein [Mycobacteroides abscessus subsp. abscessus]MBM6613986.1 hypothetical protein [Desemzia sp. RIT 804]MBM6614069.1 hypothetical protein [Desemzia sp. RIT 804]MBM6614152.1 hypothetical protein [Desemzia sp. RIT 804]
MRKRTFGEILPEIKEETLSKEKVELKQIRIGIEAHEYLKNEAFKRGVSMKNLLDEIVKEYKEKNQ